MKVKKGSVVKFHYKGRLEDGQVFDSSEGREPLEFTVGSGTIIPGLENEMIGMAQGDKKTVAVEAKDAYGEPRNDLIQEIPKGPLPKEMELKIGTVILLRTKEGQPFPAKVTKITEKTVVLDLNHPLAGKKLLFEIELVEVK